MILFIIGLMLFISLISGLSRGLIGGIGITLLVLVGIVLLLLVGTLITALTDSPELGWLGIAIAALAEYRYGHRLFYDH